MLENYKKTLKSAETEDWLDYRFVRPFSYLWALLFARFDIHPNTVTILSMIIGAASCVLFAHGSYYYEGWNGFLLNIIAILMLIMADVFDCTDGQLARLTGKKSRIGRILDGAAGFVWFVPIYLAFVYRFYIHHDLEFTFLGLGDYINSPDIVLIATAIVFVLSLISGFAGISGQQRVADYYIQIHLFFLKGEKGAELDNSAAQQKEYDETPWEGNRLWKAFLQSYVGYTKKQEAATPRFQALMAALKEKYGSHDAIPADLRNRLLNLSRTIMPWNAMLTFNFRTAWLILFCLIDLPACYFLFEVIVMEILTRCIIRYHEKNCEKILQELRKE